MRSHPTAETGGWAQTCSRVRRVEVAGLIAQLAGLLAFGWAQFRSDALSLDFAGYAQGWWLLGVHRLDPFVSVLGVRLLANDGELLLWPLALFRLVSQSGFVLIVLQDVALVATSAVTISWILDLLAPRGAAAQPAPIRLAWFVLVVALLDPWCFLTAASAVHLEPFAGLFAILASRALWRGRAVPAAGWSLGLLAVGTVGGLTLAGIGLGALVEGRGQHRTGSVMALVGAAWVLLLLHLHLAGEGGRFSAHELGYLVRAARPPGVAGLFAVMRAVVVNVVPQLPYLLVVLLPLGLVGVARARAAFPLLAVFLPAAALAGGPYANVADVFQIWPALPLVAVASFEVLAVLASRRARVLRGGLSGWTIVLVMFLADVLGFGFAGWLPVPSRAARVLRLAVRRARPGEEVIASYEIAGRFAGREDLEILVGSPQRVPVAHNVLFVLAPSLPPQEVPSASTRAFAAALARLGARVVLDGGGVEVLAWRPPPGTRAIVFPSAQESGAGPP